MKLPEIRFTVRRLMIAVVVAALLMAFANMIRSIRDDARQKNDDATQLELGLSGGGGPY